MLDYLCVIALQKRWMAMERESVFASGSRTIAVGPLFAQVEATKAIRNFFRGSLHLLTSPHQRLVETSSRARNQR